MSDAAIFILVFGGLFVLRIIAATVVFMWILPRGDRCPMCDAVTERVHAPAAQHIRLAKRWCLSCGWEGMMRIAPGTALQLSSSQKVEDGSNVEPLRKP